MNKSSITDRVQLFRTTWTELAPEANFGGMTLAQFETAIAAVLTTREDILALEAQMGSKRTERANADAAATLLLELVVNSVRGAPEFGSDSGFYRSLGYVRKSERKSGLTHKSATPALSGAA